MAHRISNISNNSSEDFPKESNSEADSSLVSEKKSKRKDSKKLFPSKKDSKDKGYSSLNADNSQESIFLVNNSSTKQKKPKIDSKIGLFNKKTSKDDKKSKESSENSKRVKSEKHKKSKDNESIDKDKCFFGNTLEQVLISFPSNDGLNIPYPLRICMDIVVEKGLELEGIYKRHLNKSQLESIFDAININFESKLDEISTDPYIAAAIIKKFLRELKSPLINEELLSSFEKCDSISDKEPDLKIETISRTIDKLPTMNRDTFVYLILHLSKVLQKNELNKMDSASIILTFQPAIKLKDRLFKFILKNSNAIFKNVHYKKYRIGDDDSVSRLSAVPETIEELENEIAKQETILDEIHGKIGRTNKENPEQEQLLDELWALQRYITSLKRKVKKMKAEQKAALSIQNQNRDTQPSSTVVSSTITQNTTKPLQNTKLDKPKSDKPDENNLNNVYQNELIKVLCENEILIESMYSLFEKLNKEKVKIFDMQQQLAAYQMCNKQPLDSFNYEGFSIIDLQRSIEQYSLDNREQEEKIQTINKKVKQEQDKIFELKLKIQLLQYKNNLKDNKRPSLTDKTSVDIDTGIMTKL